jgi:outer membrane protein
MKNISTILSALALIGVIVLFGLHFSNSKPAKPGKVAVSSDPQTVSKANIAYIDIDTFEANYNMLKDKKEEFTKRKNSMEAELQRSVRQLENDVRAFQQKAQTMSQAEGEAAEKKLVQIQRSLETRKATMEEQFAKDQFEFNQLLHKELDAFLEEYNEDKRFDYILSYQRTNPQIMYVNKDLDITQEVIKGMNERPQPSNTPIKAK